MVAILQPCIEGPLSEAAKQILAAGEHGRFQSTRAITKQLLDRRTHCHGPISNVDEQARVLNLIRALEKSGRTHESAVRQARASSTLNQRAFDAACARKPHSRIRERANEIKRGRVTRPPIADSNPNDD